MAARRDPVRDARFLEAPGDGVRDLHALRSRGRRGLSAPRRSRVAAIFALAGALGVAAGLGTAALAPGWDAPAPPANARFSLLAVGDSGQLAKATRWLTPQQAVGDALAAAHRAHPVDVLLLLGDNFYPDGLLERDAEARIAMNLVAPLCPFLDLAAPLGARVEPSCSEPAARRLPIPLRGVLGNHDWRAAESPGLEQHLIPRYLANFVLRSDTWVEETAAGVSLVFFESTKGRSAEGAEALRAALAAARGPWRIVVSHHPIDDSPRSAPLRAAIEASGAPVSLWLAGHEHNLQISEPGSPGPALQAVAGSGAHASGLKYEISGSRFYRRSLGYARVDLVTDPATAGREELVVSLVTVRPIPAALWERARTVARFAVASDGAVRRVFQEDSEPPVPETKPEDEPFDR